MNRKNWSWIFFITVLGASFLTPLRAQYLPAEDLEFNWSELAGFKVYRQAVGKSGDQRALILKTESSENWSRKLVILRFKGQNLESYQNLLMNPARGLIKPERIKYRKSDFAGGKKALYLITPLNHKGLDILCVIEGQKYLIVLVYSLRNPGPSRELFNKWTALWNKVNVTERSESFPRAPLFNLELSFKYHNTDIIILLPGRGLKHRPLWSPDSKFLAFHNGYKWQKVDLRLMHTYKAKWYGRSVAAGGRVQVRALKQSEVADWKKNENFGKSQVKLGDGRVLKFKPAKQGPGVAFTITDREGKSRQAFVSMNGAVHSMAVSPDEKYLAFISDQNGLVVYKLR